LPCPPFSFVPFPVLLLHGKSFRRSFCSFSSSGGVGRTVRGKRLGSRLGKITQRRVGSRKDAGFWLTLSALDWPRTGLG
jgi:hypothetical protein